MSRFQDVLMSSEWRDFAAPAQRLYSDSLPYHNWGHALHVAEATVDLVDLCQRRGLDFPIGSLIIASAWHDAGYQEDHRLQGELTREKYSARLARDFLMGAQADETRVALVEKTIIDTTYRAPKRSTEGILLHYADISNMAESYEEVFAPNSARLWQEAKKEIPELEFPDWKHRLAAMFGVVLTESQVELVKLGEPITGREAFPTLVATNADRLLLETEHTLMARIAA